MIRPNVLGKFETAFTSHCQVAGHACLLDNAKSTVNEEDMTKQQKLGGKRQEKFRDAMQDKMMER